MKKQQEEYRMELLSAVPNRGYLELGEMQD
jgi:hypothetical protein